ncbi:hypothetical protein ACHAXS_012291 [Conticribra weissflogii]
MTFPSCLILGTSLMLAPNHLSSAFITQSSLQRPMIVPLQSHSSISDGSYEDEKGNSVVSVSIKRTFPHATTHEAKDAWIQYHWKKGGGLPLLILSSNQLYEHGSNVANPQGKPTSSDRMTRTILPVWMKEDLVLHSEDVIDPNATIELRYEVTDAGPFYGDVIPRSHSAKVIFTPIPEKKKGCEMTWDVEFSTTKWHSFYEFMTKWTVGTASSTIQEVLELPRLFTATTTIECNLDPISARRESLEFFWGEGGGLPLIPPIPFGKVLGEGSGLARENLLRIPPFLTESIVDLRESEEESEFTYRLNNPGHLTFPFLIHTHLGRVQFSSKPSSFGSESAKTSILITWEVKIRPFKLVGPVVEKMVEMVVTTIIRNLRIRLTEPGARVVIKPPRGNENLSMGLANFGSVPKESWLGGVLDSHLSDKRSTMDQTLSMIQPWTWGRSGSGDDNDCLHFKWQDGN